MMRWLLARTAGLVATLVVASLVIFAALDVLPGNAAQVMLGPDADAAAVAELTRQLGLDASAPVRYLRWVGGLLSGDLGTSYVYGTPVGALIAERLSVTVPLAILAMAMGSSLAIAAGMFAAAQHRRAGDALVRTLAQLGAAVPSFWLAMLLILLFAVQLQWVPAGGFEGWSAGIGAGLQSLLLPAVALAVAQAAVLARITRSAALDVLSEDFVRTARAKGLTAAAVMRRHVLGNTLIAVLTVMGMQFSMLLAGSIVVENVFYLPGLGRLMLTSIANRDLIVVQNCVMLLVAMVVVVNAVVDMLHGLVDPRMQDARRSVALGLARANWGSAA